MLELVSLIKKIWRMHLTQLDTISDGKSKKEACKKLFFERNSSLRQHGIHGVCQESDGKTGLNASSAYPCYKLFGFILSRPGKVTGLAPDSLCAAVRNETMKLLRTLPDKAPVEKNI